MLEILRAYMVVLEAQHATEMDISGIDRGLESD